MMDEDDEGINLPAPDASAQPSLDNATSLGIPQPDNHSVESPNELPLSHSFQIDPVLLALSDPAFVPPTEIFALQDIEDTHLPAATPSEEEDDLAPNIDILRADSPNISSQGQSSPGHEGEISDIDFVPSSQSQYITPTPTAKWLPASH